MHCLRENSGGLRGTVAAPMVKALIDTLVQVHTAQQRKSAPLNAFCQQKLIAASRRSAHQLQLRPENLPVKKPPQLVGGGRPSPSAPLLSGRASRNSSRRLRAWQQAGLLPTPAVWAHRVIETNRWTPSVTMSGCRRGWAPTHRGNRRHGLQQHQPQGFGAGGEQESIGNLGN